MTLDEVYTMLQQMRLPLAYNHFKKSQDPPYLIYLIADNDNFAADNKVYYSEAQFAIELYTEKKDLNLEIKLEVLLEDHELYYEKYETYIDTEKMYQIRYEI